MRKLLNLLLVLACVQCLPVIGAEIQSPGEARNPDQALNSTAAQNELQRLPEEVVITGQRTLRSMRNEIDDAQDAVFALWNELNEDISYDIHCKFETRAGTRIKSRICMPNFYYKGRADEAAEFLTGVPAIPLSVVSAQHYPVLEEKMYSVAAENPELQRKLEDYYNLTNEYSEYRQDYFARE